MVSPVLAPVPVQQFNVNGVPLSGGKLFTYAAGTGTKQTTYTDSTGTTPNTNPIILNSSGYPQNGAGSVCGIWANPALSYKFVLSTSTDTDPPTNPYWTVDNIAPSPAVAVSATDPYGARWTTVQGFISYMLSSVGAAALGSTSGLGVQADINALQVAVAAAVSNAVTQASAAASAATAVSAAAAANSAAAALQAAGVQNVLPTNPSALPYQVTAIALGSVGSGATVSGVFNLVVTGGPLGHQASVTVSGGAITGAQIINHGISASNTAPVYTLPTITGLTGATAPTATVGTIPVNTVFAAPSADGTTLNVWYNAAGTLTQIAALSQPLTPAIAALLAEIAQRPLADGNAFSVFDQNLNVAFSVLQTGQTFIANPLLPNGVIHVAALNSDATSLMLPIPFVGTTSDAAGYAIPFYDITGHIAGGFLTSGQLNLNLPPIFPTTGVATMKASNAVEADNGGARDNATYYASEFIDPNGKSQIRVSARATDNALWVTSGASNKTGPALTWDAANLRYLDDASGAKVDMYVPITGGAAYPTEAQYRTLTGFGDSLFQGIGSSNYVTKSWLGQVATMLGSAWTVNNRGVSAQTSTQIANRQGAYPITMSVTGNQIPASGGVVLTAISNDFLMNEAQAPYPAITGALAGIPGTLTSTSVPGAQDPTGSNGTYTFTRTTAGSATACPAGSVFVFNDPIARAGDIQVLEGGPNNPVLATVLADIAAMVACLTPLFRKYVVVSNLPQITEINGSAPRITINAINAALLAAYPNNYLDFASPPSTPEQAWLLANYGWSPTTQDTTDIGNGVWPTSLHGSSGTDIIHLNDTGYALWANRCLNFITSKGWTL